MVIINPKYSKINSICITKKNQYYFKKKFLQTELFLHLIQIKNYTDCFKILFN